MHIQKFSDVKINMNKTSQEKTEVYSVTFFKGEEEHIKQLQKPQFKVD